MLLFVREALFAAKDWLRAHQSDILLAGVVRPTESDAPILSTASEALLKEETLTAKLTSASFWAVSVWNFAVNHPVPAGIVAVILAVFLRSLFV